MIRKDKLVELLAPRNQDHILRFWEDLSSAGQQRLTDQILQIDWNILDRAVEQLVLAPQAATEYGEVSPAPYYPLVARDASERQKYAEAKERGEELLRSGKVAGFTVAGGQGTRLGYNAPKGTFPISPIQSKSLFQLFAESIARARERYDTVICWYIMTSPINDSATRKFFEQNNFFGLDPQDIKYFPQGLFPAVDHRGKLLLSAPDSLALSPNGHGGSLTALEDSGALRDMAARGVEHISYWQVDNPLVRIFDPLFIGLHDLDQSDMSSRCLIKTGPIEKLGNFCLKDEKLIVVEYSDMPEGLARETEKNGRLKYRAGSPAIHIIRRDFVEKITADGGSLPLHRADKTIPCIDDNGNLIAPEAPNGIKFEMFIFDALPLARQPLVLEADRREQFAPVKNRTGTDSAESCRKLMIARAAEWLENAGVKIPRGKDGAPLVTLELSSRSFLDKADVAAAVDNSGTELSPGDERYYE